MWRNYSISFVFLIVLSVGTGCQATQPAFTRMAGDAGSAFSAASTTLSYVHEGKITKAYAQSSFVNFQSELSGLDQTLPSQQGAPDKHILQHLLDLYKSAMQAVNNPCLDESCNWRTQVAALDAASKAFLKVSGQ